ncbi:MAG TPA: histidine kinase, partial [Rugosimonospora sp.]|nr:histidine kinase [Rugosimonospora sp.]
AVTAGLTARHVPGAFGPGEILILLCLLVVAIRGARPWPAAATATALGAAIVTQPVRVPVTLGDTATTYAVITVLALIVLGVATLSGYLRSLDQRRLTALAELRRAEKLATAADLHDFVAHHVTGILVQAQMARMLVDSEPERLAPILAGIEHAAAQALDSMRRTVTLLRADANPAYDLAAVPDLVSTFRHSLGPAGPAVTFRQDPDVPGDLPPEIQAAAFRVIQEALTNARTHAANATRVDIELRYDRQGLHITACDDGTPDAAPPHPGRGFGLLGLTERVTALNGSLDAGPRPTGGWRLAAVVPPPAG